VKSDVVKPPAADGYRGIWYYCNGLKGRFRYKYSGGLGTYCAKHIPLAWHAPEAGKTFFCYGGRPKDKNTLLHMVAYYDHRTGAVPRPRVLMDKRTGDAHDNCTLLLDEKGHLWVFSASHGNQRGAYVHRSAEPYDIETFVRIRDENFSYPQAWPVPGQGVLFLHTRYIEGRRTLMWQTTPDGSDWSERRTLSCIEDGQYQVSRAHGTTVGTAYNIHPAGVDARTNLYYLQTDDFGRTWRTARGRAVAPPLTDADNPARVLDVRGKDLVYLKDLNFDAAGRPIVLVVLSASWRPGPEAGPRRWTTCHWTGTQWRARSQITSDNCYDTGCLHVEADGSWRIIGPTETGPQPFYPGGEMALWSSTDRGASWEKVRQITRDSRLNHTYARRPVNAHQGFYALWADGNGARPSESRIYFCDRDGQAVRLPTEMKGDSAEPEKI